MRLARPSAPWLIAAVLALSLGSPRSDARDADAPPGRAPDRNFSSVHAETEWVVKAFEKASEAADEEDWPRAVRALQEVVEARTSRESPGDAAPYARAVRGTTVYEGAWIVARHQIAGWGTASAAAYEQEFGATATSLLRSAVRQRRRAGIVDVAQRFLPTTAGRRAALLLVDLALERDDRDTALGWLDVLEDLDAVSRGIPEALAPWQSARIQRAGRALAAGPEQVDAVMQALRAALGRPEASLDAVPDTLLHRAPPPTEWLTTAGNNARSAVPPALGSRLRLAWARAPSAADDLVDTVDPEPTERFRTSVWLPPRAVATREHLLVSDGEYLHIYDLLSGARVLPRRHSRYPGARPGGIGTDTGEDRRTRFGLLEGHGLTLHPVRDATFRIAQRTVRIPGPGYLVLAAVPDGRRFPYEQVGGAGADRRDDHIQALHWDGAHLLPLWRAGGRRFARGPNELGDDTRLYGAPVVYRGRVWVAGVRPAAATSDRWESWIFSLDPGSGDVVTRTHLGTGTPVRLGRMDEVIPTSPAAAHGRVVVGTSLGMVAAVDADDGRLRWVHRYDRAVTTETRRLRDGPDPSARTTGFANEPPILALGRCFVTPTDSSEVLALTNRPLGPERYQVCDRPQRIGDFGRFAPEHVAGVLPEDAKRPRQVVLVGSGAEGTPPGPLAVGRHARDWHQLWASVSPTGFGSEPYGRALVTGQEVFVSTRHGIAVFDLLSGGAYLDLLDQDDIDEDLRPLAPPVPYGNLIPIPGRGLVAVSATSISFWARLP